MNQNTKLLDGDLQDLHTDLGRIFAAVDLQHCGWKIAALRNAAHEFASVLFSIFRDQTSPTVRRQLARVISKYTTAAVASGQQDLVRDALIQFDQLRLPADQLSTLIRTCLQALQTSATQLDYVAKELDAEISDELGTRGERLEVRARASPSP